MLTANVLPTNLQEGLASDPGAVTLPGGGLSLDAENARLTNALANKFEEIRLIYDFAERLELDEDVSVLCHELLEELQACIDASWVGLELHEDRDANFESRLYFAGSGVCTETFRTVSAAIWKQQDNGKAAELEVKRRADLAVINDFHHPLLGRCHVVAMPIERRHTPLGQLIAVRSVESDDIGTVEVDLLKSTMMVLGVHLTNQRQYVEVQQMFESTVNSLVSALDAKDPYTCGHSSRVAELAAELSQRLGYDEHHANNLRMAGILHDIGKIGVQDSVLRKPGRLTEDEFAQIKQHPVLGYEILKGVRQFRRMLPAVRHHHESWDGGGYPDGLAGSAIPRDAQILAVADAFDAMISDRPYRNGMPLEKVTQIFQQGRGKQWAADVVDMLLGSEDLLKRFSG